MCMEVFPVKGPGVGMILFLSRPVYYRFSMEDGGLVFVFEFGSYRGVIYVVQAGCSYAFETIQVGTFLLLLLLLLTSVGAT